MLCRSRNLSEHMRTCITVLRFFSLGLRLERLWVVTQHSYWLRAGRPRFDSRKDSIPFFATTYRQTHWGPPSSYATGTGVRSSEMKRTECEADLSPSSSAEVKNTWNYTSIPLHVFMSWCLIKHRDNFTLRLRVVSRQETEVLVNKCCI
jgi:hypothetical protein